MNNHGKNQIPVVGEPFKEYVNGQIDLDKKCMVLVSNQTRTP